eukprot:Clim_evm32s157 gene=Clim_evmTU32s157
MLSTASRARTLLRQTETGLAKPALTALLIQTNKKGYSTLNVTDASRLPPSEIPMSKFQASLPRWPIPKLEDTLARWVSAVEPITKSPEELAHTKKSADEFLNGVGPDVQAILKDYDAQNKNTSYVNAMWFDMYLKARTPLPINYNPFMVFTDDPNPNHMDQLTRAAILIRSSCRMYNSYRTANLAPDLFHLDPRKSDTPLFRATAAMCPDSIAFYYGAVWKAYALDMSQYPNLFASTRVPSKIRDILVRSDNPLHVSVQINGHFYKVQVLEPSGEIKSVPEIRASLEAAKKDADKQAEPLSLGYMTTEDRDIWAEVRTQIKNQPGNAKSLEAIDGSIFHVVLEDALIDTPETCNNVFLHGNGSNRWYDKSFSLLVSKNGMSSVNFEHSWGDGVAVLRYFREVYNDSIKYTGETQNSTSEVPVEKLEWHFGDDTKKAIATAKKKYDATRNSLDINIARVEGIGKKLCKAAKISPDAVAQNAFHIAYRRMYGHTPATYESCSTAAFRGGRTETVRSATMEGVALANAINNKSASPAQILDTLKAASAKHGKLTTEAATGVGCDRHLFALRHMAEEHGVPTPAIFEDPLYARMNHIIVSTSTLVDPALQMGGFGAVTPDGYGVGYQVQNDFIGVNVTSYGQRNPEFVGHIVQALRDLQGVMEGKDARKL